MLHHKKATLTCTVNAEAKEERALRGASNLRCIQLDMLRGTQTSRLRNGHECQVVTWVNSLSNADLVKYSAIFLSEVTNTCRRPIFSCWKDVNGAQLLALTKDKLKSMGVKTPAHVTQLLQCIAELQKQTA